MHNLTQAVEITFTMSRTLHPKILVDIKQYKAVDSVQQTGHLWDVGDICKTAGLMHSRLL